MTGIATTGIDVGVGEERPSGPKGSIVRGNLPDLLADPLQFLDRCAGDHGDVVPLRFGPKRAVLLNHPSLIEEVLVRSRDAFTKPFAVGGDRLQQTDDDQGSNDIWQRPQLARSIFHHSHVAAFGSVMSELIQQELGTWHSGDAHDLSADMDRLTFAIATRTLFGANAGDRARLVADALPELMDGFFDRARALFLVPRWLPTPANRRINQALKQLDSVMAEVLIDGQARNDGTPTLLDLLATNVADEGTRPDPARIRGEALTFLLAGYETVAATLAWTWSLLAQHPEVDRTLAVELELVLQGRPPTAADLPRLPFTRHVIQEALRLYPPLWVIVREARRNVAVGGYQIEGGTLVLLSPWVVQRDPRFFARPEVFAPERWENDFEKRLPRHAYLPFGGGRRGCVGSGFAMLEAQLILASVAQRFRPEATLDQTFRPRVSATLRPQAGVHVVLRDRAFAGDVACAASPASR